MIRTSLDTESALSLEAPIRVSPAFPAVPVGQSELPQLTKPRPLLREKNGLQPPVIVAPPPPPARPTQRIGKRRFSMGVGFKGLAKRRRRANSESQSEFVLPSHFLLGGNIFDPLNLNSLLDEEVNRTTNQETPKSSPLPCRGRDPVEILVPRDITDPLNLKGGAEGRDLLSPIKTRRRHRRHHAPGGAEPNPARLFPTNDTAAVAVVTSVPASPLPCELNTAITCRDDVAPPPILPRRHTHPPAGSAPGDGRPRRRRRTISARCSAPVATVTTTQPTRFQTPLMGGAKAVGTTGPAPPPPKKDRHRYQNGNHCRYYGYHGFYGDHWEGRVGGQDDPRLRLLEAHWFRDKAVLDIGCGAGHITIAIARRFGPTHILGVELDRQLVRAANQNIRHFLSHDLVLEERGRIQGEEEELARPRSLLAFPLSFRVSRGPIAAPLLPLLTAPPPSCFPHNVTFIQGDYVSEGAWPGQGLYDVIVCVGVLKWVHLHHGDGGVARLFRRAYQSLSPGGFFLLETQPWSSYCRHKRASARTFRMFRTLKLRPDQFTSVLTDTVGFSSYRLLTHTGNQRPIYLFHKGSAPRN